MTVATLSATVPNTWVSGETANQNYTNITKPDIEDETANYYANILKNQIDTIVPAGQTAVKNPYSSLETYTLAELIYNNIEYDNSKLPGGVLPLNPNFGTTTIDVSGGGSFSVQDALTKRFGIETDGSTIIKPVDNTGLTINTVNSTNTNNTYLSILRNDETEVFSIKQDTNGDQAKITTNGLLSLVGSGANIKINDSSTDTFTVDSNGNTSISGTLNVTGDATLNNSTFNGSTTFSGSLTISSPDLLVPANTFVKQGTSSSMLPSARIATQGDVQTATLGLTMKEPVKVIFDFSGMTADQLFGAENTQSTSNEISAFRIQDINDTNINSSFTNNYTERTVTDTTNGTVYTIDLATVTVTQYNLPDRTYPKNNSGYFILGIRNQLIIQNLNNNSVGDDTQLKNYLPTGTRILLKTDNFYFDGLWIVIFVSNSNPANDIEKSRTWLIRAPDYDDIGRDPTLDQNSYTFVEEGNKQGGYILNLKVPKDQSTPTDGEGMWLSTISNDFSGGDGSPGNNANSLINGFGYANLKAKITVVTQFSGFGEISIISTKSTSNKENVSITQDTTTGKAIYTVDLDIDSSGIENNNIEVLKDILKSYDQTFQILFENLEISNFTYSKVYTSSSSTAISNA